MADGTSPAYAPLLRRLVRSYGLLVLIAIGFLLLALLVREQPKTVPVEGLGSHHVPSVSGMEVSRWH